MRLVVTLFIIGAFLGPYAFIGIDKLHFVRLVPLGLLLLLISKKVQPSRFAIQLSAFFVFYLIYTLIISLLHLSYIQIADIVNLMVLLVFVLAAIILIDSDKYFFHLFQKICWLFALACIVLVIWEVTTWKHLPYSTMANVNRPDFSYYHLPTAFYTNPNDFAFVFILVVMYLLYRRNENLGSYLLIIISFVIIYFTEARLALLGFSIFVFFYISFFRVYNFLILILVGVIGIAFMTQNYDEISFSGLSFDFEEGGSISRRYHLYITGLKSVFHNFGTGFGVGGYHYYYTEIVKLFSLHQDSDPHNFYIEMLINSGIYVTSVFVLINVAIFGAMVKNGADKLLLIQFCVYNLLLLSSSSSLFLWPHYLFFLIYAFYPKNEVIAKASTVN